MQLFTRPSHRPAGRMLTGPIQRSPRLGRRMAAALAAATLVVPLGAIPGAAQADTAPTRADAVPAGAAQRGIPVPELKWGSCGDPKLGAFDCASVEVPTDYDRPHGPTTTIALTRLPASDPARKIGTLFTNPGGPGGPGVDFIHQVGQTAFTPQVRARFDILGFDPRGVGKSDPVTCYPTEAEEAKAFDGLPPFPMTRTEERQTDRVMRKLAVSCLTTSPDRMTHYSTANVARDMDLLRQAVGDEKLTYIGYSYGTYLGATYAKLFPGKIRALVVDGTLSPEAYSGSDGDRRPLGVRLRQGEGGAETFAQFKAECGKAGPQQCSLAALGDPDKVAESVLERLKTHPVTVTLPNGSTLVITYQLAVAQTFFSLYDPLSWPDLADFYVALAGTARARSTQAPKLAIEWNRRKEEYTSIGSSLQLCVEAKQSGRPAQYPRFADAADRRAPHFGRMRAWVALTCEYQPLRDHDAYLGPWRQTTKEPVLVIGTRYDPATPYSATRPYANHYPNARMVTVEGWGHGTIGKSACADQLITRYLVDRQAPADGTSCQQDRKPFDPVPTNAKRFPLPAF